MSGVFTAVKKVFAKVVKVVKKIAIPALIIGAIVLTGGAAIGALPAMGAMLGSIGITGGLASVLGGAVSMGAVGAVTSGAISAATGGNILKGATKGFLMGAATGGVMGGLGMIGANGILGGGKAVASAATSKGLLSTAGPSFASATAPATIAPDVASLVQPFGASPALTSVGPSFASAVAPAVAAAAPSIAASAAPAAATAAGGTGLGGLLGSSTTPLLMQTVGSAVSGLGQGMAASAQSKDLDLQRRTEYDRTTYNYGYANRYAVDKKGHIAKGAMPIGQDRAYNYSPTDYTPPGQGLFSQAGAPAGYYAIDGNRVVFVPAQG